MSSQAPELREGKIGIIPFDCPCDNLRERSFFPLLARAGLPRIRFHDLRHSCATLLLSEGVHPKIVSDLLGHSQIGITLDLYSHVTATMQAVAAEAMGRLLGDQDDGG